MLFSILQLAISFGFGGCYLDNESIDFNTKNSNNNSTSETSENSESNLTSEGTVRFVVLGDAGVGNQIQYDVGNAIKNICDVRGCDFALYLGDNFYETGVTSINDEQFIHKFEDPYANLDFPFYAVLGNHDYGLSNVWDTPDPQIEYSAISDKWMMPARYHSHTVEHILFVGIDSNAIMWDDLWEGAEAQAAWVNERISTSDSLWKFGYGHHPYISNGQHGSAGNYDGFSEDLIVSGIDIKNFVEDQFCEKIDVYFSGHDHDLQWLEPSCGVEFIVSGAGAKQRGNGNWGRDTRFEAYGTNGFLWVEVIDSELTGVFYDSAENVLYESTISK